MHGYARLCGADLDGGLEGRARRAALGNAVHVHIEGDRGRHRTNDLPGYRSSKFTLNSIFLIFLYEPHWTFYNLTDSDPTRDGRIGARSGARLIAIR